MQNKPNIVFFGTPTFAVGVLEALHQKGITPSLIVSGQDKPQGRGLHVLPTPVKEWALANNVQYIQPKDVGDEAECPELYKNDWDVFIVAAYGVILPKKLIEIPKRHTLNVHPSLLPKLRGASPLQETILHEDSAGVTIIRLDEKMDHGPIIVQKKVEIGDWPVDAPTLEHTLATEGGNILADALSGWLEGSTLEQPQNDSEATYTKKIKKEDALINLLGDPETEFRKIQAYIEWPKPYFFVEQNGKQVRVIINKATVKDGKLVLLQVTPEGKKMTDFETFQKTTR
jgi:methionyl-tRNA formyltransferase